MKSFLDTTRPFPYCPGCGHPHVLRSLDAALGTLEMLPERAVIVTDIGCVGLADPYFPTLHTVHTLHGRSVAIAAGLRMGDRGGGNGAGPLKPIVLIGDGGAGIGLLHLVHAAQMNVDVTVIVHNNLVYGMTGGQHSVMTPSGMKTIGAPEGCLIPPLNLDLVLSGAGCGFFARAIAPDDELAGILAEAIRHPGFACVEVFDLCPTFATAVGGVTGKGIGSMGEDRGLPMGIVRRDASRPVFLDRRTAAAAASLPLDGEGIVPEPSWRRLDRTARFVVAGRAGEGVQSAALLAASAACAAGLQVAVRTDNTDTQGIGFSLAEVTVAPDPIGHTGLVNPDFALVLTPEGVKELASRGLLTPPGAARRTLFDAELEPSAGPAIERSDLRKRFGASNAALGGLIEEITRAGWWDRRAWLAAVQHLPASHRTEIEAVLGKTR